MFGVLMYIALIVPFIASFSEDFGWGATILGVLIEIILVVDIAINFMTAFVNKHGK